MAISAQTPDLMAGCRNGTLKLLKVPNDAGRKPVETPCRELEPETGPRAVRPARRSSRRLPECTGCRRPSTTVRGHVIEGGYLLAITGQGDDGSGFRFNDLEIIPDKKEYRPGDTLRLLINTNRTDLHCPCSSSGPSNSNLPVYPRSFACGVRARSRRSRSFQTTCPTSSSKAVTVADGKVHQCRAGGCGPAGRLPVVDIAIEPSRTTYMPGEKAKIKLKLTNKRIRGRAGSTAGALCRFDGGGRI